MSEIEKLYSLAGFKRSKPSCAECFLDRHSCCRSYDECPELYPPFTAEKQIEITQKLWKFKPNEYPNFDLLTHDSYGEMVAELANHLWQDLADTEQEEIRKILKG